MSDITCHAANRLGLDYREEARRLGPPVVPIIDMHLHINGRESAALYREVADLYGVERCYSMSHLEDVEPLRDVLGDRIRFTAVPNYGSEDPKTAFTTDWLRRIEQFAEAGSRVCKFWAAPRSRDYEKEFGLPEQLRINSPARRESMELARSVGMMFMTHIADPDTWFQAKYSDASVYGTKREQYEPFEAMVEEFDDVPWIAAHMGGFPEDLEFLDGLLTRHSNLYLDTSATKWMVRELSKHPAQDLVAFLTRWDGRIMFGSDIVTMDEHLHPKDERDSGASSYQALAAGRQEAFDLYASRYFALRTLWETEEAGESPIADPDLHMVDPDRYQPLDAPMLRGKQVPSELLRSLYRDTVINVVDAWHDAHP